MTDKNQDGGVENGVMSSESDKSASTQDSRPRAAANRPMTKAQRYMQTRPCDTAWPCAYSGPWSQRGPACTALPPISSWTLPQAVPGQEQPQLVAWDQEQPGIWKGYKAKTLVGWETQPRKTFSRQDRQGPGKRRRAVQLIAIPNSVLEDTRKCIQSLEAKRMNDWEFQVLRFLRENLEAGIKRNQQILQNN